MKIDPQSTIQAIPLPRTHAERQGSSATEETQAGAAPRAGAAATVEVSARARELHAAVAAAEQAPDVRTERVADARQRLADGRYQIDPEQIASRLLDRRA